MGPAICVNISEPCRLRRPPPLASSLPDGPQRRLPPPKWPRRESIPYLPPSPLRTRQPAPPQAAQPPAALARPPICSAAPLPQVSSVQSSPPSGRLGFSDLPSLTWKSLTGGSSIWWSDDKSGTS
jgi:hypothetical protein